jgi:hypothetical protein
MEHWQANDLRRCASMDAERQRLTICDRRRRAKQLES